MAMNRGAEILNEARSQLSDEPVTGWIEVRDAIMSKVRLTPRTGEPLTVFTPDGDRDHDREGSQVRVSDRMLISALRESLSSSSCMPENISVVIDGERCAGIRIDVVGTWNSSLTDGAAQIHERTGEVIRSVLGFDPQFDPDRDIHVSIVDVEAPDTTTHSGS